MDDNIIRNSLSLHEIIICDSGPIDNLIWKIEGNFTTDTMAGFIIAGLILLDQLGIQRHYYFEIIGDLVKQANYEIEQSSIQSDIFDVKPVPTGDLKVFGKI